MSLHDASAQASDDRTSPIVCVCQSDDRYAVGLAVTVRSLLENLRRPRPVELFILDGGILPETRERLLRSWEPYELRVTFVPPDLSRVDHLSQHGYLRTVTYFNLLIPDLLPAHYRRAIYLDCDLLVVGDIGEVWETELGGYPVAAVQSTICPYLVSVPGLIKARELGVPGDTPYFNNGIMLMDLDRWREERIGPAAIDYIERNRQFIATCDQDGINAVLGGRWLHLDPRWNVEHCAPGEDALIVHYLGHRKPWHPGCRHPMAHRFFEYLDRTDWRGWRPEAPPEAAGGPAGLTVQVSA